MTYEMYGLESLSKLCDLPRVTTPLNSKEGLFVIYFIALFIFSFVIYFYCFVAAALTRKLTNSSEKSAITAVDHHALFPSIHDAVMSAMQSR